MKHAVLGASSSHRWMNCPGSVRLSAEAVAADPSVTRSGPAAQEGTAAHAVADMCLRNGESPDLYLDTVVEGVSVDQEMVRGVALYRDQVLSDFAQLGKSMHVEVTFPLAIREGMFGTADCIIVTRDNNLLVYDFKYGSRPVSAQRNPQLMYYALGAVEWLEQQDPPVRVSEVQMHIVQPRVRNRHWLQQWGCSVLELYEFAAELSDAATRTDDPNAELNPGDWCLYCHAKPRCPAQLNLAQQTARVDFDEWSEDTAKPPAPDTMTDEQLQQVLDAAPTVENWLTSVRKYVRDGMARGTLTVPGYKLVAKNTQRRWRDETETAAALIRNGASAEEFHHPAKMFSPAQVEKAFRALSKDVIAELVIRPKGDPVLAQASDARPALTGMSSAQSDFTAYLPSETENK